MRGFTLVEMLVVLVLASLMLLLIPPLFSGSVARVNLNSQAEQVSVSLRRARSQAVASADSVPWIMDVEEHSYQIGTSGKPRQLDKNIEITFTTARSEIQEEGRAAIRFYPDGGASGGQIKLQREKSHKTISIDWLTGGIHVE